MLIDDEELCEFTLLPLKFTYVPMHNLHVSIPGSATCLLNLHFRFKVNKRLGQNRNSLQPLFFEYDLISFKFYIIYNDGSTSTGMII